MGKNLLGPLKAQRAGLDGRTRWLGCGNTQGPAASTGAKGRGAKTEREGVRASVGGFRVQAHKTRQETPFL